MKLSGNKKIILLGIILLIIAGIVVIALKGVNVSLILHQHESLNLFITKEINLNDIKDISKDVFKEKKVIVRELELFNNSINIVAESITDEEKESLIKKINEKYQTEFTVESIEVKTNSNIRIRDLVRPYIKPVFISSLLIIVYMIIRFRKLNMIKLLAKIFGIIILTEALIASLFAIFRIPLSPIIINIMGVVAIIELIIYMHKIENMSVKE